MRLIDADALIQKRNHAKAYFPEMYVIGQGYVMDAPTVDAVLVVRGEWIDSPDGDYAICSNCHIEWNVYDNDTYRFQCCPACGAKMDAEE